MRHVRGHAAAAIAMLALVVAGGCASGRGGDGATTTRDTAKTTVPDAAVDSTDAAEEAASTDSADGVDTDAVPPPPILTRAARDRLEATVESFDGQAGIAIARARPDGTTSVVTIGDLQRAVAWSTIKVPLAMAAIAADPGTSVDADVRAAITRSDNAAATRLWQRLGAPRDAAASVDAQLRLLGDERTHTSSDPLRPGFSPFGQTNLALADQARSALLLHCTAQGRSVLELMRQIDPSQAWGIGSTSRGDAWKGGWGPGTEPGIASGYLTRQFGLLDASGESIGIAIAAVPANGSFASGSSELTVLAQAVDEAIGSRTRGNAAAACGQ